MKFLSLKISDLTDPCKFFLATSHPKAERTGYFQRLIKSLAEGFSRFSKKIILNELCAIKDHKKCDDGQKNETNRAEKKSPERKRNSSTPNGTKKTSVKSEEMEH